MTETAKCAACGREFTRRKVSNPRRYCDAERCQKIKNIKNTVAKLSDLNTDEVRSPYREISRYNGGYSE